jgi:hypothetical protein
VYELVLSGGNVPGAPGAPPISYGADYAGPREVGEGELARVKLRYKHVDASEEDAALEVTASLTPAEVAADFDSAGPTCVSRAPSPPSRRS